MGLIGRAIRAQRGFLSLVIALSLNLLSCGDDGNGIDLGPSPSPIGGPSVNITGTYALQASGTTCEADGSSLEILQVGRTAWMRGGFAYGQTARYSGYEILSSVSAQGAASFSISGATQTLRCDASLLGNLFQGTCTIQGTTESCDFAFGEVQADDQDGDGVPDAIDNCPDNANPDQGDIDADGSGDSCDDETVVLRWSLNGVVSEWLEGEVDYSIVILDWNENGEIDDGDPMEILIRVVSASLFEDSFVDLWFASSSAIGVGRDVEIDTVRLFARQEDMITSLSSPGIANFISFSPAIQGSARGTFNSISDEENIIWGFFAGTINFERPPRPD